jgi:Kef-type K+ transport system membrane component KefB
VHKRRRLFADALDAIGIVSFAFFIPVYFAIVGLKLDLIRGRVFFREFFARCR